MVEPQILRNPFFIGESLSQMMSHGQGQRELGGLQSRLTSPIFLARGEGQNVFGIYQAKVPYLLLLV